MTGLEKAESILITLSDQEQAEVFVWVARRLGVEFPGIESRPDVLGGEPCVVRTRIPVWAVAQATRLGASHDEILQMYPSLRKDDLIAALVYYRLHFEEIESQIAAHEAA